MKITVELVEEFLNYYRNQNLKPDTIKNYERDF
nr:MAG TPA: integrase [Caudoviricetes sp.]